MMVFRYLISITGRYRFLPFSFFGFDFHWEDTQLFQQRLSHTSVKSEREKDVSL